MNSKTIRNITLALFCCLICSHAMALSTDRDQPADIEADDINFDLQKGIRTFTGNVLAVQGTLKLKADKFVANYKDGELTNATAWGSLARFRQRPDGKENDVEGWAKKIIVNQTANTLTLVGKAALKQGGDTARGDTIIYNMATDRLQVKGRANMGTANKASAKKSNSTKTAAGSNKSTATEQQRAAAKAQAKKELFNDNADGPKEEKGSGTIVTPTKSGRSRLIIQPK